MWTGLNSSAYCKQILQQKNIERYFLTSFSHVRLDLKSTHIKSRKFQWIIKTVLDLVRSDNSAI